jgi:hypothetical protein
MTASSAVLDYIAALQTALAALTAQLVAVERVGRPGVLAGKTAGGDYVREGDLSGIGTFSLHGVGCLVEFDDETLVDFDWNADGAVVFDAWRVRRFCRSRGAVDLDEAAIVQACRQLVADGRLADEGQGWFRLQGGDQT